MTARIAALNYLEQFIGLAYRWGGDDAIAGFDCSGLMVEVLQGVGVLPRTGDWSAEGLRLKFGATAVPIEGCLAFRMSNGKAVHVGMVWSVLQDGTVLLIEAGGGDSTVVSEADAVAQNAFVKLRPVWAGAVYADPFTSAAGDV